MDDTKQETLTTSQNVTTMDEVHRQEVGEGMRSYQSRILDELPGAAFAVVTLVWVITCFATLIW